MIDLPPDHLETVTQILAQHIPQCDVWLFGSRATGQAKPHSDLDLAIITHQPLTASRMAALRLAFEDSHLPIKVDLVDWTLISDEFREVIKNQFVVLQKGLINK